MTIEPHGSFRLKQLRTEFPRIVDADDAKLRLSTEQHPFGAVILPNGREIDLGVFDKAIKGDHTAQAELLGTGIGLVPADGGRPHPELYVLGDENSAPASAAFYKITDPVAADAAVSAAVRAASEAFERDLAQLSQNDAPLTLEDGTPVQDWTAAFANEVMSGGAAVAEPSDLGRKVSSAAQDLQEIAHGMGFKEVQADGRREEARGGWSQEIHFNGGVAADPLPMTATLQVTPNADGSQFDGRVELALRTSQGPRLTSFVGHATADSARGALAALLPQLNAESLRDAVVILTIRKQTENPSQEGF